MCLISIHAPREGSDMGIPTGVSNITVFLSTLPARGATVRRRCWPVPPYNFYPRSPRGERRAEAQNYKKTLLISIHAPREGSDVRPPGLEPGRGEFLSTLPTRGATST